MNAIHVGPRRGGASWEAYILPLILVVLILVGLAVVIGPTGKQKEAIDKIEAQDKSKMDKKDVFAEAKKITVKTLKDAIGPDRKAIDLSEAELERLSGRVYRTLQERGLSKDVSQKDAERTVNEVWREMMADEKVLPSDDAAERWRELEGAKFETIRKINLEDETGFLNCPQIDVFADAGRTQPAGQMNHDEWVVILEESGSMTKVKRRRDKMEGWIETKVLRRIYSQEDLAKGPVKKKPKEYEREE